MGDHIFRIRLCMVKDGKTHVCYTDEGIGYPPDSIELECDINKAVGSVEEDSSEADNDDRMVCIPVE